MNKKISLGAAIAFILIVATATFSMTMTYAANIFNVKVVALKEREAQFEKFGEIDRQTRQKYFGIIDGTMLMDSVAKGYIDGLGDPYATYIDAKTYDRMMRKESGSIAGIGAEISANSQGDGYLIVKTIYPDSPAQAGGIEVGDLIIKIDEDDLTPENSVKMLDNIQGESGTSVSLTVRKGNVDSVLSITRRQVIVPSVHSSMIPESEIGYIIIDNFSENTSEQFNREIQKLITAGAKSLIFDLRDNKGGVLRSSTRMLDKLLPAGIIASYTRNNGKVEAITSDANEISLPMVLIVNAETASYAELFAQVLREYGKARIVGTNTLGKGVITETIPLGDGSAISITIAEIFGSKGETFNNVGVKPDYEVALAQDLNWKTIEYTEDAQMKKAIEVATGTQRSTQNAQEIQASQQSSVSQPESAPSTPQ